MEVIPGGLYENAPKRNPEDLLKEIREGQKPTEGLDRFLKESENNFQMNSPEETREGSMEERHTKGTLGEPQK